MGAFVVIDTQYEEALETISGFTDLQVHSIDGLTIYTGQHPDRGSLTVIISSASSAISLLPVDPRLSKM